MEPTFITFEELARNYVEIESKPFKSSWRDDERRLEKLSKHFGQKKLNEVTTLEVAQLYRDMCAQGKYFEANRILQLLHRVFEVARNWDLWPNEKKNPAIGVKKHREESRERFISEEELPILWEAFGKLRHAFMPSYFKLLLLTGLRRNTLRNIQWTDVNLSKRHIIIRQEIDKTKKTQKVHLSQLSTEILFGLPKKDPWVFWSRKGNQWGDLHGAQMSNTQVGDYWEKVKLISGLHDIRIHDLRRTTGSYLGHAGLNEALIGGVLNHAPGSKSTAIYTRFRDDHLRDAFEKHGQIVQGILDKSNDNDEDNQPMTS